MAGKKKLKKTYTKFMTEQSLERDGRNVPHYMVQSKGRDSFFFFGTKSDLVEDTYGIGKFTPYNHNYVGKPQDQDGHVLVVGGAGSGKSSCIAIPNLETWKGTIFAIDIKGELSEYWKNIKNPERDFKIFNFSKEEHYAKYDPFYFLRQGGEDDLVQNAREIAQAIIQIPPTILEPFWSQAAQHVLTAAILYGYGNQLNFNDTMRFAQEYPIWKLIENIANSDNVIAKMHINQFLGSAFNDPEVGATGLDGLDLDKLTDDDMQKLKSKRMDLSNLSDNKMMASISAELSNRVMVFATDPRIKASFTHSSDTIEWEDLEKQNIFMRIAEDKLGQWDGAITLMLTQLIRTLERRPDKYSKEGAEKNLPPILLLLDEFPRLGKVDVIQNAVSTLRSKGVTICLIMQSLAQLDKTYGKESRRIIVDNCQYKAILSVTDSENQKIFSDMVGSITVGRGGISIDNDKKNNHYNMQFNETHEPMLYPHEFATLKDIVLLTPEGFCRVNKLPSYNNDSDYDIIITPNKDNSSLVESDSQNNSENQESVFSEAKNSVLNKKRRRGAEAKLMQLAKKKPSLIKKRVPKIDD